MFDKSLFAKLLSLAQGDRTIISYGKQCGISAPHISRLRRELIDTPPSPITLRKMANFASNDITYKELMDCAGFNEDNGIEPLQVPIPYNSDIRISDRGDLLSLIKVCEHLEPNQIRLLLQIAENFK